MEARPMKPNDDGFIYPEMTAEEFEQRYTPLEDWVLVRLDPEEKQVGNIWIARAGTNRRDKQCIGTVVKHGHPGHISKPDPSDPTGEKRITKPILKQFDTKPGERVVVMRFGGHDFKTSDGVEYKCLTENDIACVIEGGEPTSASALTPRKPLGVKDRYHGG
jgi:co-chaperonin GroES (HSP10)